MATKRSDRPAEPSSKPQAASSRQSGLKNSSDAVDPVLQEMNRLGLPQDRETYLALNYLGNPPEELDAEEEADLPEQFQLDDEE